MISDLNSLAECFLTVSDPFLGGAFSAGLLPAGAAASVSQVKPVEKFCWIDFCRELKFCSGRICSHLLTTDRNKLSLSTLLANQRRVEGININTQTTGRLILGLIMPLRSPMASPEFPGDARPLEGYHARAGGDSTSGWEGSLKFSNNQSIRK